VTTLDAVAVGLAATGTLVTSVLFLIHRLRRRHTTRDG
jgi:hypothetical protein